MKTYKKQLFFGTLLVLFIFSGSLFAQSGKLKQANKLYNNLAYAEASEIYLKLANSDYRPQELLEKLGNTFYFNANYKEAAKWYGELFSVAKDKDTAPIYYLRYAQSLKSINNNTLATEYFDTYTKKAGISEQQIANASDYLKIIEENEALYNLKLLDVNTKEIDYGVAFLDDIIVFASSMSSGKESAWDGFSYLDLYQATIDEDGSLGASKKIEGDVNTKFHESSAVFTKDGTTMYFSRSNSLSESKNAKDKITNVKIYRAHLVDGKWTNVEDLSINNDNFSTAHPALNAAEDKLFFASDMPQSLGLTDIFVVKINADGSLGSPLNLGPTINTKGRESFPFITPDKELYFSSDGHFGLGAYDVYSSKMRGSSFGKIVNVGSPINSPFDDFAFVINDKNGYISSNRPGGKGEDDIYSFEKHDCQQVIAGVVRDKSSGDLLLGASVVLYNAKGTKIDSKQSDTQGAFSFNTDCEATYKIVGLKKNYKEAIENITTSNVTKEVLSLGLTLAPEEVVVVRNQPMVNINPIYFESDKSVIKEDAAIELGKVVRIMNKYPRLIISLGSHTDSRASDKYNWDLSNRRAKSTIEWILNKGIDPSRISGKGYGETQLVNKCSNGVSCSEVDHQLNRRSEFVIVNPEAIK